MLSAVRQGGLMKARKIKTLQLLQNAIAKGW